MADDTLLLKISVAADSALRELGKVGKAAAGAMAKFSEGAKKAGADWSQLGNISEKVAGQMGAAAKSAAREFHNMGQANRWMLKNVAQDANISADKVIAASRRQAAAVRAGYREMARGRTPGNFALDMMQDDLGAGGGVASSRPRGGNFASAHAAAQAGIANREYVIGGEQEAVMGAPTPKRKGFIGRFRDALSEQGGGGGRGRRGGGSRGGRGGGGRGGLRGDYLGLGEASQFRRVLLGAGVYQGAQFAGGLADTYAQLQMRLIGLTGSQEKATETFHRLQTVAQDTRSSLESTTEGYVRIRNATKSMNLSEEDSFKLMTNLNLMLATSGASTEEAKSGMMQLTQAFAKGKLDGDEFRSVAENMPNILTALSKSTGKTEGQLRAMSTAGQLTREMLVKMLLNVKDLQQPVATFGNTWEQFKNRLMEPIGVFVEKTNLVENFSKILEYLAAVIVKYVIPAASKLIKFFQEHTTVLKVMIGLAVAKWIFGIAQAIIMFPFNLLESMATKWALITKWADAAKVAMAGANAAGAAGAGGAAGGGMLAALAQFARSQGSRFLMNPADLLTDQERSQMLGDGPDSITSRINNGSSFDELFAPSKSTTQSGGVKIDQINVNIQATDAADAKQKFGDEMENTLRHAAASGGIP